MAKILIKFSSQVNFSLPSTGFYALAAEVRQVSIRDSAFSVVVPGFWNALLVKVHA